MNTINWSADMCLGLPQMDAAHESFLQEIAALEQMEDPARFCSGFLALIEHVETDFREEEQQMEEIDYPGLACHREQHARVLATLHRVAPCVMGGDMALGREALRLLPQWFMVHLSTMDTVLALTLKMIRSEQPELGRPRFM
jgi:hemerythrin